MQINSTYYHLAGNVWLYTNNEIPLSLKYLSETVYSALSVANGTELYAGSFKKIEIKAITKDEDLHPISVGDVVSAAILSYNNLDLEILNTHLSQIEVAQLVNPKKKRLVFWQWWLTTAIPEALELTHD